MDEVKQSRSAVLTANIISKLLMVFGGVLAVIFGLALIGLFTSPTSPTTGAFVLGLILTALGVYMFWAGRKRGKQIALFKQYVTALSADPTYSITGLATSTGQSVDQVMENVKAMIDRKFFVNAYIDNDRNCLVFPQKGTVDEAAAASASEPNVMTEYVDVTCKGCGAANRIRLGTVAECEFCGSKIG